VSKAFQNALEHHLNQPMTALNGHLRQALHSEVALVQQVSEYIVSAGGKRLRPALVYLITEALQGPITTAQHNAASIVELIHTATLLHDDVVDESDLRRGRSTANATFGNAASVLVGDFLYSRAFQMMNDLGQIEIFDLLANATNTIAEGEVQQLMQVGNRDLSEAKYRQVISAKTATLFAAACELAARLQQANAAQRNAARAYGHHLGIAFQIADDVLDLVGDSAVLGKNLGDDLAEGKLTLPMIHALSVANAEQAHVLNLAINEPNAQRLEEVMAVFAHTRSIAYAQAAASAEAQAAKLSLAPFADSSAKSLLLQLAEHAVNRDS
jgi:octaprenyl-diphosphate synthase